MADPKIVREWLSKADDDLEFEKTHNLIKLLTICSSQNGALQQLMAECERLNTVYVDTRYPVHWPTDYTKEKALRLKNYAEKISELIKEIVSGLRRSASRVCPGAML